MTRSSSEKLFDFDPEIERTFHQRRRTRVSTFVGNSSSVKPIVESFESKVNMDGDNNAIPNAHAVVNAGNNVNPNAHVVNPTMTINELGSPDLHFQNWCINYPDINVNFELKSGLIHLLPKFNGLSGEEAYNHLKMFHMVCIAMKPVNVTEDQIKMRAFPFSLEGSAKSWLLGLPPGFITSWNQLKKLFLERYFPASRTTSIRKDISRCQQIVGETLYEYLERFKALCASCPHHQIADTLLIEYFHEGLLPLERELLDSAAGGGLLDLTVNDAWELIEKKAKNSQQFGSRQPVKVNEVGLLSSNSDSCLESKIDRLTSAVEKMAMSHMQNSSNMVNPMGPSTSFTPQPTSSALIGPLCSICSLATHVTNSCPYLNDGAESCNAIYPSRPMNQGGQKYDPYSNTYNPGWRDHPNLRYGNGQP
ncbi:hypothetical protein QN277_019538 [Acacia crassicarpa]|uniref:Retrotransposon gag domain-containing protein n=1 Tax=Acacia crassicarpa TaxID=499986 RepID=A0AAE1JL02_9FABA|nr:hypothetical protein QN277_019538 [Acacia crassicarpa]